MACSKKCEHSRTGCAYDNGVDLYHVLLLSKIIMANTNNKQQEINTLLVFYYTNYKSKLLL